jgi:hypothetical protein
MNLFFISLITSLFIQPASHSFADDETYATYKNDYYGFSYQFPKDWSWDLYNVGDFGISYNNFHDQYMDNSNDLHANVAVVNMKLGISTDAFYETQKKQISTHRGYTLIEEGIEVIDGKNFSRLSFSEAEDSSEYLENIFSVYMYCTDTRCFAFSVQFDKYLTTKEGELLQEIVSSFRIYDGYSEQRKKDQKTFDDAYDAGDFTQTQRMIDAGFNVNDINEEGLNRFTSAIMFDGNDTYIAYLLDHGADPNLVDLSTGQTAIFLVSFKNNAYFQLLVDHGADLTFENEEGNTVYQQMKEDYRKDDASFLKSLGAK